MRHTATGFALSFKTTKNCCESLIRCGSSCSINYRIPLDGIVMDATKSAGFGWVGRVRLLLSGRPGPPPLHRSQRSDQWRLHGWLAGTYCRRSERTISVTDRPRAIIMQQWREDRARVEIPSLAILRLDITYYCRAKYTAWLLIRETSRSVLPFRSRLPRSQTWYRRPVQSWTTRLPWPPNSSVWPPFLTTEAWWRGLQLPCRGSSRFFAGWNAEMLMQSRSWNRANGSDNAQKNAPNTSMSVSCKRYRIFKIS